MSTTQGAAESAALAAPFTLPGGLVVPNRLAKAAMEEMMGPLGGGDPNPKHFKLYEDWARGGWGMIITGNVMVSAQHLGTPADVIVPVSPRDSEAHKASLQAFSAWAVASHTSGNVPKPVVIMQLCHTGRQSMRGSGRPFMTPSKAPSAVMMNSQKGLLERSIATVAFGTPDAMTHADIKDVVESFVAGARLAHDAGFEGAQLHISHGYLLAQFLSPNVNVRTDAYGGSPLARMKIVFEIIDAVRAEFPMSSGFCLGLKLNSSDYVQGGLTETDALDNVKWIAEHGGVDFIEISGGTYENAEMLKEDNEQTSARQTTNSVPENLKPTERTHSREAFFLSFASSARALLVGLPAGSLPTPAPAIMVTGGFRTRAGMSSAVMSDSTDFVGIGRPACVEPALPLLILDPKLSAEEARSPKYSIKGTEIIRKLPIGMLLPGVGTLWHTMALALVASGEKVDLEMTVMQGAWRVWLRDLVKRNLMLLFFIFAPLLAIVKKLLTV